MLETQKSVTNSKTSPANSLRLWILLAVILGWVILIVGVYYKKLWNWDFGYAGADTFRWENLALPFVREAFLRAARGIGSAGLMLGSATVVGFVISKLAHWDFSNWRIWLAFNASLGIGFFSYTSFLLANLGLYQKWTLRFLILLPVIGGIVWWGIWGRTKYPITFASFRAKKSPLILSNRLWVVIIILALIFTLISALAPETQEDALHYHLNLPRLSLETGSLAEIPGDFTSFNMMNWELWFGFGLALGGQVGATLLHFMCLPLIALVVYEIVSRYLPETSPWLAVALFVTIPTIMWEATTANIDLALTFHITLALYALLRYSEKDSAKFQWLILASVSMGMALATKHLALFVLAIFGVGLVIKLLLSKYSLTEILKVVGFFVIISLLFPLPWYIRNYISTGNPVFPELYKIFGANPDRWNVSADESTSGFLNTFGVPRDFVNLITLPWQVTMQTPLFAGAFGPLFLALLPALVLSWRKSIVYWLGGFVTLYTIFWASPVSSFQLRFLLPVTPVLAILGALAFSGLLRLVQKKLNLLGVITLTAALGVLLVLNLPPFIPLQEKDRVEYKGWFGNTLHSTPIGVVIGGESKEEYLIRNIRVYQADLFIDKYLPPNAKIISFTYAGGDTYYNESQSFIFYDPRIRAALYSPQGERRQLSKMLQSFGIEYLLVEKSQIATSSPDWATSKETAALWYEVKYEDSYYILYKVKPEALKS